MNDSASTSAEQLPPAAVAHASLHNEDVASAFDEMADVLDIQGENTFRVRAYRRAAQVVRTLPRQLADMHGTDEFDALPGIGADLALKIGELLQTGRLQALERERRRVPSGLRDLLRLPALGPVRVRALFTQLRVKGLEDLRHALEQGRVERVRGFGPASDVDSLRLLHNDRRFKGCRCTLPASSRPL